MKEQLEQLKKAIEGLVQEEPEQPKEMSIEDFVAYATGQIEAAGKDSAEVKKARLGHLRDQIAIVLKSFEGPTPTPGGLAGVTQFQDPGQVKTTSMTETPTGALPNPTGFSTEPVPPAVSGAGSQPPGGTNPPQVAGASGQMPGVTPATATFAKALEDITKKLDAFVGAPSKEPEKKTEEPVKKGDVQKAHRVVWPLDMATKFGLGETEDPEVPDWGFDPGSEAAKELAEIQKAKADKGSTSAS